MGKLIKINKKDLEKRIVFPKTFTKDLAELVGIHFGDGCLQKDKNQTYRISYTINLRDKEYAQYIINLFFSLFNTKLKCSYIESRNAIFLYIHSKSLCTYFNQTLKIPHSPKKQLVIPSYIKENKELTKAFIRGIFYTDGCVTTQKMGKYSYELIKICTSIPDFAVELKSHLNQLGIKSYISKKKTGFDVTIRNKTSYLRFMKEIKPKNEKDGDAEI